ncbi:pantetheine-phosphate adenylyltransferase [Kitasatospora sp. NPDC059599]|uniref:pantetheine-phosphate adenylyltransferase n=1 Tax=Kitasatospora sp. NPDC059599 TaxID=3346880 RepID=UPI0036779B53
MRALFPGSFDPVTPGHQDVLHRAALLFDEVVVCVMFNANKTGRFPVAERLDRLRTAATDLSNVTVDSHTGGLLVDYCRRVGIDVVTGIETVFITADPALRHVSSTLVTAMGQALPLAGQSERSRP